MILLLKVKVCSTVTRGSAQLLDKCGTNMSLHAVLTVQCTAQKLGYSRLRKLFANGCRKLQQRCKKSSGDKALEEEQKLAQERGPILGVRRLFTEQTVLDMLETSQHPREFSMELTP